MITSIIRIVAVLTLVASFFFSPFARVVQADGATPTISIVSVKAGESVTIRTQNFPAKQLFTVRMGKYGTKGVDGTVVDSTNSGSGGSFDVTYKIPAALKNDEKIAIRLESTAGYFSYNWFENKSQSGGGSPSTPGTSTGSKPGLTILAVEKNTSVKVRAERLPANQTFTIRVGTYNNFFKDYVVMGTVASGSGGTVEFSVNLPEVVKGVEWVSIRIDSAQKVYAYNAFKNVSGGTTGGSTVNPPVTSNTCQIISVSPSKSLAAREDFDAIWEIKNISGKTWDMNSVDYKYVSGTAMHEKAAYDMTKSVGNNETVKIIVDMKAPTDKGSYSANWAIAQGGTTLCSLKINVSVK
jgi:hypothetical protein